MRRFIAGCTLATAAWATPATAAPLKCVSNDVNVGPAVVSDSVLATDAGSIQAFDNFVDLLKQRTVSKWLAA